jgi:hypothetical protein
LGVFRGTDGDAEGFRAAVGIRFYVVWWGVHIYFSILFLFALNP